MTPDEMAEFKTQMEAFVQSKTQGYIVLTSGRTFYLRYKAQQVAVKPTKGPDVPVPPAVF